MPEKTTAYSSSKRLRTGRDGNGTEKSGAAVRGVVCFWLFALAFGTVQGKGLRIQPAVQTQAEPAVQTLTVTPPQLTLPCRAAILIDQTSGAVLYEMNADQTMPIASITKVMTLLLTLRRCTPGADHGYRRAGQ